MPDSKGNSFWKNEIRLIIRQAEPDLRVTTTNAFTLIELLVVVLIIGILAAVALPQYQKVVEKSRATQAITMLKSLGQAQEAYFMANGSYASTFDELDVEMPFTGTTLWRPDDNYLNDTRSNADWSFQIFQSSPTYKILMAGRLTGKYKGGGFLYYITRDTMSGVLRCGERASGGVVFTETAGDYCMKIFKASEAVSSGSLREYNMP